MIRHLWTQIRGAMRLMVGWRDAAREDREAREEMRFHVDMQTEELQRSGLNPTEARRRAHLTFGGVTTWTELARDEYRWRPLEEIASDVRYATRALLRVPSFTIAVVLSLAIGIGATSTAYTVTDRVLLRPLSYHGSERILSLWTNDRARPKQRRGSSLPEFNDWVTGNPDMKPRRHSRPLLRCSTATRRNRSPAPASPRTTSASSAASPFSVAPFRPRKRRIPMHASSLSHMTSGKSTWAADGT